MKPRGFILIDLIIGITLISLIAAAFCQVRFAFQRGERRLTSLRAGIRNEQAAAYLYIVQHNSSPPAWHITPAACPAANAASLPAHCRWLMIRSASDGKLPPLFALQSPAIYSKPEARP